MGDARVSLRGMICRVVLSSWVLAAGAAAAPVLDHVQAFALPDGRTQVSWISSVPMSTGRLEVQTGEGFETAGESPVTSARNHRVAVRGWKPGDHVRIRVRVPAEHFTSPVIDLEVPTTVPRRRPAGELVALNPASAPLSERAMIAAVPFARGRLWQAEDAWAEADGAGLASQITVSSRWPDGSIRWLLARFIPPAAGKAIGLRLGQPPAAAMSDSPFRLTESPGGLAIDNGAISIQIDRGQFALLAGVTDGHGTTWSGGPASGNVRIVDGAGTLYGLGPPDRLEFEERGPVRVVVRAEGPFVNDAGGKLFRYRVRYFLAARSPLVQVQLTFLNNATDPLFQPLSSIGMRLPLAGDAALRGQLAGLEACPIDRPDGVAVQQVTDRTLRIQAAGRTEERSDRCPGWAVVERGPARMALVIRDFWETWPKGIAAKPDGLHVRILPPLSEGEYAADDLQDWLKHYFWFAKGKYLFKRGMSMRIDFQVRFGRTDEAVPAGGWDAWARSVCTLAYAAPPPGHLCASGAFGPVVPAAETGFADYEQMVQRSVAWMDRSHDQAREYGWMSFGDWYGERKFNWGNNEYDWPWATAVHFARTGIWECIASGEQMARHSSTIDAIHVPWMPGMAGRAYIHCVGHVGAGVEPPAFPVPDADWNTYREKFRGFVDGGIDRGGHIFEEGKYAMYMLTGDRDILEAGQFSAEAQAEYLTPDFDFRIERAAGWPLINAVAAYEATADPFFLNAARIYIQRILEKQDPSHGGWMLPQDPNECDHPPPHLGGKSFATGVLLYGMIRYDLVEPRPEVRRSIVRACEWLVDKAWNREKQGFRYKTGCDKYADSADGGGTTTGLCSAGLAYGWLLSGDPRFAEVLTTSFAKLRGHAASQGKGDAAQLRQSAFALPVLRKMEKQAATSAPAR